ncbi:hypothetical protein C7212DRAFT_342715 [Tuber magnatum]|uniref:Uncharacterized protein n=1 Tax=Tuber magnatum TaxID=42249 RepID=A0A317SSC8_9PEZI|nr:hypothetical protein C7212DRAFT_342715 [Tuber magnatum]
MSSLQRMMENKSLVISLAASAAILALVTPIIRHDYQAYLSLDPGGVPYDAPGWLLANLLRPFGRDTMSIAECAGTSSGALRAISPRPRRSPKNRKASDPTSPNFRSGVLGKLARLVFSPNTVRHGVANEMVTSKGSHELLPGLRERNSGLVEIATSVHERRGPALFIHRNI